MTTNHLRRALKQIAPEVTTGVRGTTRQPISFSFLGDYKSHEGDAPNPIGRMGTPDTSVHQTSPRDAYREEIVLDGQICAVILPADFDEPGIQFLTANELPQQLASMSYKTGKVIPAHTHNCVLREASYTQEALFIRKGKVRVDFYTQQREYRMSRVLGPGDVIILMSGGHGFEVLEDLNMVEVKQGPYVGDADKTRFEAALPAKLNFE
jgi:hypothetical protein